MMQTNVSTLPYTNDTTNPPSRLPRKHRYSSRSNSISGSSVTTVQRVASRSSSRGGPGYPARSQSPGEVSLHALRLGNGHARRRSVAIDSSDRSSGGLPEGLNRWSQSTESSLSSRRHHRASSSLVLDQPLSPPRRPSQPDYSPRIIAQTKTPTTALKSRQRPVSPIEQLERPWLAASRPGSRGNQLPALQTAQVKARQESDTPSTAVTSASITPSTGSSYTGDFFTSANTSPKSVTKSQRPQAARTATTPSMNLNYSRMPRAEDVKESAHFRRQSEHMINMKTANVAVEEKKPGTKTKDRAEREKKAMLSKALEKANTAVVLDNKQNFLGALDAYSDACMLLQQVMDRSVNAADKKKLDAIKVTYSTRIEELKLLEETRTSMIQEKGLPSRPRSEDSLNFGEEANGIDSQLNSPTTIGTAVAQPVQDIPRLSYPDTDRDSFFSRTMADVERAGHFSEDTGTDLSVPPAEHAHIINQRVSRLPAVEETRYLPAPLVMKKTPSPSPTRTEFNRESWMQHGMPDTFHTPVEDEHPAADNVWLDTINEGRSSRSSSSSVHSLSSETGLRTRKALHGIDDSTTAELDAAFDAAVEAAYDEGFEPDYESKPELPVLTQTRTKSTQNPSPDVKEIILPSADDFGAVGAFGNSQDDDEDERILDEFSQDYGHGFNFAFGTKAALPRQSDSSGYSRSTWQSSQASERLTAGTSLSTVAENDSAHRLPSVKPPLPSVSPASGNINFDPLPPSAPPSTMLPPPPNQLSGSTVRNRRLSGQNARELKIETFAEPISRSRASTGHTHQDTDASSFDDDTDTHKEVMFGAPLEASPSDAAHDRMLKSPPSLDMLSSFASSDRLTAPNTPFDAPRSDDSFVRLQARPTVLRKNKSSLSLRADHTVLLPSPGLHEMGEATPMSAMFNIPKNKTHDSLTSQRVAFNSFASPSAATFTTGGNYLFDTSLSGSGRGATSPLTSPGEMPPGLEPCPESFLLRPFWLMRCLASTITHSRGGFVTQKLFVPREAWMTRGVKLKNIDDKVSNCDLLTAALGQLSQVDTFDADAVMDELQRFEEVMERVQQALMKKLGNEVGLHGVPALFRDAPPPPSSHTTSDKGSDTLSGTTDKSSKSHSGKGYLSSWRKLRSKSSGAPVGHAASLYAATKGEKEMHAMESVPMTSFVPVERRGQKKDVRNLQFEGPNKEYMGSLARLFLGVQVLDQIARQVEDPGLKHSSPTHVGLELSIRHAAEFFSFYICRFVLADLGMLVDKFIKRGTEWVIA